MGDFFILLLADLRRDFYFLSRKSLQKTLSDYSSLNLFPISSLWQLGSIRNKKVAFQRRILCSFRVVYLYIASETYLSAGICDYVHSNITSPIRLKLTLIKTNCSVSLTSVPTALPSVHPLFLRWQLVKTFSTFAATREAAATTAVPSRAVVLSVHWADFHCCRLCYWTSASVSWNNGVASFIDYF